MKKLLITVAALLVTGTAWAQMPLFAAKCQCASTVITADSNAKGQVRVNGKLAKLINRPDGQITAHSAGIYVDITPRGDQPPLVTATSKEKTVCECEILAFKAPEGSGTAGSAGGAQRASSSERAGQGQFDAHGPVKCAQ